MPTTPLAQRDDAAWVDPVVVERYLGGKPTGRPLTFAERQHVARARHDRLVAALVKQLRIPETAVRAALTADAAELLAGPELAAAA